MLFALTEGRCLGVLFGLTPISYREKKVMQKNHEDFNDTFEKIKILTDIQTYLALSKVLALSPTTILNQKNKNIFPNEWLYQLCFSQEISLDYFMGENIELRSIDPEVCLEAHLQGIEKVKAGFARRLKKARMNAGYSLRQLEIKTDIRFQTLGLWENSSPNNPSIKLVKKISQALKVHPVYLRTGKQFVYKDTGKPINHKSISIKPAGFRGGIGSTPEEARKNMEGYKPTRSEKLENLRDRAGFAISLIREESEAEKKTVRKQAMQANQRIEHETKKRIENINYQLKEQEDALLKENPTQGNVFAHK